METTDREGRVAKLWVSGFTPEQVEIVKTTLEGVAAVSQLSDFMPPSMIAQNGKAVVELEKRYMANSDLLLINVGDGTAETASTPKRERKRAASSGETATTWPARRQICSS